MKSFRPLLSLVFACVATLLGCGGGGGGSDSSPCNALRINGGEACMDYVPSVVLVEGIESSGLTYNCTGTLISQTAVLTAAHCFNRKFDRIRISNPLFETSAAQVFIHPRYSGVKNGFDLAIVKLQTAAPLAPTAILRSTIPPVGTRLVAYGYGLDETGRGAFQRLEDGESPLKAANLQLNATGPFYQTVSEGTGNICKGDSGGPVLARNGQGQWGIIAVTSFSPLLSDRVLCVPIAAGAQAIASPVQLNGAVAFIAAHVPDAAYN